MGRAEYGRLGLGENAEEKSEPTLIPALPKIASVACGASVSYAVSQDGEYLFIDTFLSCSFYFLLDLKT